MVQLIIIKLILNILNISGVNQARVTFQNHKTIQSFKLESGWPGKVPRSPAAPPKGKRGKN
jgi:hypothetical protein